MYGMCTVDNMKKFTLLELLIVVAIIGILASLLLPSLSTAREKAEQAMCLNNQKQIGIGAYSFTSANDDKLPSLRTGSEASNVKSMWRKQINQFISDEDYSANSKELTKGIFRCPTSMKTLPGIYDPLIRQAGGIAYNGYGLRNLYKSGLGSSTGPNNAAILTTVIDPVITYLTTDSSDSYSVYGDLLYVERPSQNKQRSPTRHFSGGAVGFVDGHAKVMKYSEMEAGLEGDTDYYLRRDKDKAWGSD